MIELYDRLSCNLMMIRTEVFNKNDETVMELIEDIRRLPGVFAGLLSDVVTTAFDETGYHEQTYDLKDCVHCLPEILISDSILEVVHFTLSEKWKQNIFDRFQKEIFTA